MRSIELSRFYPRDRCSQRMLHRMLSSAGQKSILWKKGFCGRSEKHWVKQSSLIQISLMQDFSEPVGVGALQERCSVQYILYLHAPGSLPHPRLPGGWCFQSILWETVLDQRKGVELRPEFDSAEVCRREGEEPWRQENTQHLLSTSCVPSIVPDSRNEV